MFFMNCKYHWIQYHRIFPVVLFSIIAFSFELNAQGTIRLAECYVYKALEVPLRLFIENYEGISTDGDKIGLIYKHKNGKKKQEKILFSLDPRNRELKKLEPKSELLQLLEGNNQYWLAPHRNTYIVKNLEAWHLFRNGSVQKFSKISNPSINELRFGSLGNVVFGHVCYPYQRQGVSSGVYRWRPEENRFDSVFLPRKHLYLTHISSDNSWSAMLSDSLLLMADITQYKLYILGAEGEPKLVYTGNPAGWIQYPDSLEMRFQFIEYMHGTLNAWDTMGQWLKTFSRIEKILANGSGDVLVRYTCKKDGEWVRCYDVFKQDGDTLIFKQTIALNRIFPREPVVNLNFPLSFLWSGYPTFLMNDGSIVAFDISPGGKTIMGLTENEIYTHYLVTMLKKKKYLATYVYQMD